MIEALAVMVVYFGFIFTPALVIGAAWLLFPKLMSNLDVLLFGESDE